MSGRLIDWRCPVHPHREDCECGLAPFVKMAITLNVDGTRSYEAI